MQAVSYCLSKGVHLGLHRCPGVSLCMLCQPTRLLFLHGCIIYFAFQVSANTVKISKLLQM